MDYSDLYRCQEGCQHQCRQYRGYYYCPHNEASCAAVCSSVFSFCNNEAECVHVLGEPAVLAVLLISAVTMVVLFASRFVCFSQIITFPKKLELQMFERNLKSIENNSEGLNETKRMLREEKAVAFERTRPVDFDTQ